MIKAYQSAHIANRIQQWADENNLSVFVWATVKEDTNELVIAVDYFDDEREGSRAILEKKFPEFLGDVVTERLIRHGAIVTYDRHDTTVLNITGRAEYMLNYFTEDLRFVITENDDVEPEELAAFLKANTDWAMHYEDDDIIIEVR